jgi:UDP-2,3-diacylglucosamine hydrolase
MRGEALESVSRRAVFFSDAHLFPIPRPHPGRDRLRVFLRWLQDGGPGDLWIAGDLFDYWFESRGMAPSGYEEVLAAIRLLADSGWRIRFLPGNHDWWVGPRFEEASGASIVRDGTVHLEYDGLRVLLAHGDGIGGGDPGYRLLLRPLLRNRVSIALFSLLPPGLAEALAGSVSGTSRRILRRQAERMPAGLSRWAATAIEDGHDAVLTGHTHLAAKVPVRGGVHISLGDWLGSFTWAEIEGGRAELRWFDEEQAAGRMRTVR